jgi:mannose-6-phosphate isomerase
MASPFGEPGVGVSPLPDGTPITDAIAAAPESYLGPEHVQCFGEDVAVLIKLLDAGERLPVHFHPGDEFSREHLGSRYGKTEAWIILDACPGAAVHVGFTEEVSEDAVARWVDRQDAASMLRALHRLPATPGATIYVPSGTPHAIGEGILLAELQQPTDFSVLMEWEGYAIDGPNAGHLGLGFDVALQALDRSAWSDADLGRAVARRTESSRPGVESLFPPEADAFFRAERIRPAPTVLDPAFSVLLVTEGSANLSGADWAMDLARGDAVVVPYGAGTCTLAEDAEILRCMPPAPDSLPHQVP